MNVFRDILRDNLTDPYSIAGGNARDGNMWIFANEPNVATKYPQIELKKVDNPVDIIDIGFNYMEHEMVFMNIWVYVKNGFKITVDGVEYKNAQVVEYMLGQIGDTLKDNQATMVTNCVNSGYKKVNTTTVEYDSTTQLYYGAITVRGWFFKR